MRELQLLSPFLDALGRTERILDGGCGLGEWTVHLTHSGYHVTGVDISHETIERVSAAHPECDFATGDVRSTPFADETFGLYFSWGVFEHFENGLQPCLVEARRILRPGGFLVISVPCDNLRHAVAGRRRRSAGSGSDRRFYQWRFTPTELSTEMEIAGFEVVETHYIHKRQGVERMLQHELRVGSRWTRRALSAPLALITPGAMVAHMVLAVGRKPGR